MLRIALADDCPFTVSGVKNSLGSHPDFKVEWTTVDPSQTIKLLRAKPVEVLLLEIMIEGLAARGLRLLETLRSELPQVRAFVFTSCGDGDTPIVCFRLGVAGFLLKHSAEGQLEAAGCPQQSIPTPAR